MTYIGGIEALHGWRPPGASEPAVTLGEGPYRIIEITGLSSLGDSEDNRDLLVGAVGERARPSERRGKTVAYVGRIEAETLLELREAEAALRAAFADETAEGRMDLAAHPDNVELAGQTPKFYEARALNCDIPDVQATKRFWRPFVIGLRAGDPRVWDAETGSVDLSVSHTATARTATVEVDAAAKAPTLTIELPKSPQALDIVVRNVTTGKSLTLQLPPSTPGNLTLDFGARTITDAPGADKSALLDPEDLSLWGANPFVAGLNEFEITIFELVATGFKAATTIVNDSTDGSVAWVNPGNAKVADAAFATAALEKGTRSEWLKSAGHAFGLEAGTVVTGFNVLTKAKGVEAGEVHVALVVGGVPQFPRRFEGKLPAANIETSYQAAPRTPGMSGITSAVANAEGFGVAFSVEGLAAGASASVDLLKLNLTYRWLTPVALASKATLEWVDGRY
jgi:hypothetical protein